MSGCYHCYFFIFIFFFGGGGGGGGKGGLYFMSQSTIFQTCQVDFHCVFLG